MKYKGVELKDIADTPQLINPPREMLVWDDDSASASRMTVLAIVKASADDCRVICEYSKGRFAHCAEIPEASETLATNRQLSQWLAQGNGQVTPSLNPKAAVYTEFAYFKQKDDDPVEDGVRIRKLYDNEWRKPTLEYMGIKENGK